MLKEQILVGRDLFWATYSCSNTFAIIPDILLLQVMLFAVPDHVKHQYEDNCRWIKEAGHNKLVVGSQARILYSDRDGRMALALAFNKAVADGKLQVSQ